MPRHRSQSATLRRRRRELSAKRPQTIGFKLGASLGVLLVVGTFLELGAWRLGPQLPQFHDDADQASIMVGHPTRLWTMQAGVRRNAGASATIHASGLRGDVPQSPRAAGEERILLLGDSTFFGHGVENEDTMAVRLEHGLQAEGGNVQVINGAILGYSSEQARVLMDELGWALEPTLLLIGLLWSDNTWDMFQDKDLMKTVQRFHKNPLARSRFYQLLAGWIDRSQGGYGAQIITWTRRSEWPDYGVRRVDVRRYADNLDHLARTAAQRSVGVMFIAPVNRDMVRPRRLDEHFSWQGYFDAMNAVASHHQLPVVAMLGPFHRAVESVSGTSTGSPKAMEEIFLDMMHPTPSGHQLMATTVQDTLVEQGWPMRRLLGRVEEPFDSSILEEDAWIDDQPHIDENTDSPHRRLFSQAGR